MDALQRIIEGAHPAAEGIDGATRARLAEFHGREPHDSGKDRGGIWHIKAPAYADRFRFEWHAQARKVYLIRLPQPPGAVMGDPIAEHANTHADAINAVNTYLRGYREGQARPIGAPLLGHSNLKG